MLLRETHNPPPHLPCPLAIPAQTVRAYLATRVVPEVPPVDFKETVVVEVDELVGEGLLHMRSREEGAGAEQNGARGGGKAARAGG